MSSCCFGSQVNSAFTCKISILDMTLYDYYTKNGASAIAELAEKTQSSHKYLMGCVYRARCPSMQLASKLVAASGGQLTYEGLANPTKYIPNGARLRKSHNHDGTSK